MSSQTASDANLTAQGHTPTIDQRFQKARQQHLHGNLADAEAGYRSVLSHNQQHFDAQHLLGVALYQQNKHQESATLLKRLEKKQPLFADLHSNLGLALLALGKNQDALNSFKKATALNPDAEKFWINLAAAHEQLAQFDDAESCLTKAVQIAPQSWETKQHQAAFQIRRADLQPAIESLRAAIAMAPPSAKLQNSLGSALLRRQQWQDAESHLLTSLHLNPASFEVHNNLGELYFETHQPKRAVKHYHQALALDKNNTTVMANLIKPLLELDQPAAAKQLCADILAIEPNKPEAYYYTAKLAIHDADFSTALANYQRCCALDPGFIQSKHNLAMLLFDMGQLPAALDACKEAVAINDKLHISAQCLVALSNYDPNISTQELWQRHQAFAAKYMHSKSQTTARPVAIGGARIKVGYISSDFRSHSVSFFIESILRHHDKHAFEVYCYYNNTPHDSTTERIKNYADHWVNTIALSDKALASKITQDGIDILVDLNGHTQGNRLVALSRKPAPIQVNYLGYPNTTGMTAFDFRITDDRCDPLGMTEAYYSEQLVRLTNAFFSYTPPADAPDVAEPPVLTNGHITFGSFNPLSKISDPVLRLFAQVLHAVPESRLLLQTKVLADNQVRQRIANQFEQLGIAAERLSLLGAEPLERYLEKHQQIDILLDSFPWNGHTLTCHALWMGVPLITRVGDRHAARMGGAIVDRLGLPQLAAQTDTEYVTNARLLAQDTPELVRLRKQLRPLMKQHLVDNAIPLTRELERAFRTMTDTHLKESSEGDL